jgi:Helicase associated domain
VGSTARREVLPTRASAAASPVGGSEAMAVTGRSSPAAQAEGIAAPAGAVSGPRPNAHRQQWVRSFGILQRFNTVHGRQPVQSEVAEGRPIGKWVKKQRQLQRKGALAPEQRAKLAGLPGWRWSRSAAQPRQRPLRELHPEALAAHWEHAWQLQFWRLKIFLARHQRLPTRQDDQQLGQWVSNQRYRQAHGQLRPEREAALQATPGWVSPAVAASR